MATKRYCYDVPSKIAGPLGIPTKWRRVCVNAPSRAVATKQVSDNLTAQFDPLSGLAGGLVKGLTEAFRAIFAGVWLNMKAHAWEWVIGLTMVFVIIGSARRLAGGGA